MKITKISYVRNVYSEIETELDVCNKFNFIRINLIAKKLNFGIGIRY